MVFSSINPFSQQSMQTVEIMETAELDDSVQKSHQLFHSWASEPIEKRATLFMRLAALLEEQQEDLALLATLEMGKPIQQARAELQKCALLCRYYAQEGPEQLKTQLVPTESHYSAVYYQPLGCILGIMPWNFPYWQVLRFAVPTLLAGNVVLFKHAPNVPQIAAGIPQLFQEAGFPEGALQHLFISTEQVAELAADNRIAGLTLTGSLRAGQAVGALAGKNIKPCVLELGGSDPFIVLEDADVQAAAQTAVKARLHNNGQTCIAAKRFILHQSIRSAFEEAVKKELKTIKMGDPREEDCQLGPLARKDLAEELQAQVDRSLELGAELRLAGGLQEGSSFFAPVILANLKKGMPAFDEELFGPVFSFFEVEDEKQAIALANASNYGLGASVWTNNRERGLRLAQALEAGAVVVNDLVRSDPRLPFGGIKQSGFGRELATEGIRAFVNVKSVVVK